MIKKRLCLVLLFCLLSAVSSGCSENVASQPGNGTAAVDVDLTILSSTMVMAKVNSIMADTENYLGKTIKINGPYYASYYDVTDTYYHYVVIDACCMGFEFIPNDERAYPDGYPEDGTNIEVTGVFGSYEELGQTYYYLAVDDIVVI